MQNLKSIAQKMAELWVLLYVLFCTFVLFLFGNGCQQSRSTYMQNFGLLARKLTKTEISLSLLSSSLSLSSTLSSSYSSSSSSSRIMGKYQKKILAKTPALYQVPKLRNLKSGKILNKQTDRPTDRQIFLICVITLK